ncbi:MAG: helix-turn-helix domain-containing protein [Candidatus Nanopelagicales bacterium]|nr:helix-turn-helix domain-containing protein [Candidatus Nanopelagicales bacterium]MDZ4250090.1 helix-turn-helix domain-containing protein [Candidatus Nanopelagicales bacterium]
MDITTETDTIPDPKIRATITVDDAAKILRVSRSSAYAAVNCGQIPSIRVGRRLLIPTSALARLLADA